MIEHRLALIARQPRHRLRRARGAGNRRVDDFGRSQRGAKGDLAGVFVGHREIGVGLLWPVVEIERVGILEPGHGSCPRHPGHRAGNPLTSDPPREE